MALGLIAPAFFVLSPPAHAVTLHRVEFLTQTVRVEGQSAISGFALRLHAEPWAKKKGLSLVPAIEHWRDADEFPEFGIAKVSQRDWTIGADMRYRFESEKTWHPYAGAGMALHLLKSVYEPLDQPEIEDNSTRVGFNFLAGVDLPPAASFQSSIELNYHLLPGFQQLKINWGFGVTF
jgi:hypothetical protein